jgi:hypothetical protein
VLISGADRRDAAEINTGAAEITRTRAVLLSERLPEVRRRKGAERDFLFLLFRHSWNRGTSMMAEDIEQDEVLHAHEPALARSMRS